jgi:hypothetical protein
VLTANAQIEYIIQYDDGQTVYYSGRPQPGDTCGVWFEPPTECQVLSGLLQFNDGMGGDAEVFVSYLPPDFDPDDYYDNNESGWPGFTPSAVGDLITGTPIPITFDNSGEWQEVVFDDYGYPPEDMDVGTENFYLGYKLVGGGAEPYYPSILGDAADERPYHSLCYLTDPAGSYAGESGWWAYGIDWMIRAKVNLYGDPPPTIADLEDPSDTYAPGPYTITATITDQVVGGGVGVVDEARLIYSVDGGDEVTVVMTNTGGDTYEGEIPAVSIGSKINFRIEADDDQGHTTIGPSMAGYSFTFRAPSGASILLVNDSGDTDGEEVYRNALENNGFSYDYWYINPGDVDDMGYPGDDVINIDNYSTVIWYNGPAYLGSLPDNDADLSTDPVAQFMDAGGNFFLSSSDYLGGAFNPDDWDDFVAIEGTFMYEYLKVSDGWSDAHLDPGTGYSLDTLHFGIEGDPISDEFAAEGIYSHPDPNYNDYCYPLPDAETCFLTEIDQESAGIRYSGDFNMVFLPWVLEAADDPDQAEQVLLNVLTFFNQNPGPDITVLQGSRYGIYSNNYPAHPGDTPHPIVVALSDPDGVGGAVVKLSWDGEAYETYTMTEAGADTFRYTFSSTPAGWSTLTYSVMAHDANDNVSVSDTYTCWTTGLEYDGSSNFLFCSDQPYNDYFGQPNMDSTITMELDQIPSITYQIWDVDEYGTPDFWTVLNNYDHVFWVGLWDWEMSFPMATEDNPFTPYLASGKDFLFSSEEMFGTWTGWTDMAFEEGNFAYDWLHVDSLINDVGYTTVNLSDPPDEMCAGMSSTFELTPLAIDIYTDWITPNFDNTSTLFFGEQAGMGSWWAGVRDDVDQHNSVCLGFSLFMMDQTNLDQFILNVIMYWLQHQGSPVAVEPEAEPVPLVYSLDQNYPNPFNPVTQIRFSLPENARVELTVYNLMGQEVARLLDRPMQAGHHSVTFDASQLSSGVYFYKMKTQNFEKAMKMILVK